MLASEELPSAADGTHVIVRVQRGQLAQLVDGAAASGVRLLPRSDNTYDLMLMDAGTSDLWPNGPYPMA